MEPADKSNKERWVLAAGLPLAIIIMAGVVYLGLNYPLFSIPSESGVPTVLKGDLVLTHGSKFFCGAIHPKPGDLVVFRHKKFTYLKRLVGMPGERIRFIRGVLTINGQPVRQTIESRTKLDFGGVSTKADIVRETLPNGKSYAIALADREADPENTPEFILPAGQYFVVGDSRDNSLDSRFAEDVDGIGLVPAGNLCAVAVRIVDSPDRTHAWNAL